MALLNDQMIAQLKPKLAQARGHAVIRRVEWPVQGGMTPSQE